jgi:hypothetical protein
MYPGDGRSKWSPLLLTDARAVHLWDEPRIAGRFFLSLLPTMFDRRAPTTMQPVDDALWDAFFIYAPGDGWHDAPALPVRWGFPIMATREQLISDVDALVKR